MTNAHASPQISYDHGVSAKKLIGATIGAFFDGQVEKYREREALVVKHQNVRWTWGELGRRVDDLEIVRGLERGRQDQCLAPDLVHRVLELAPPVGRVDVDQHQPRLGGSELRQGPFRGVGRPDADPVAALQAQGHQAGGEIVDPPAELAPRPAHVLVLHHQRLALAVLLDLAVEKGADRGADQLLGRDAVVIRDLGGCVSIGHARELRTRPETNESG